jgi:hypothetical protein
MNTDMSTSASARASRSVGVSMNMGIGVRMVEAPNAQWFWLLHALLRFSGQHLAFTRRAPAVMDWYASSFSNKCKGLEFEPIVLILFRWKEAIGEAEDRLGAGGVPGGAGGGGDDDEREGRSAVAPPQTRESKASRMHPYSHSLHQSWRLQELHVVYRISQRRQSPHLHSIT